MDLSNEIWVGDGGVTVVNDSSLPMPAVLRAVAEQNPELAALASWGASWGRQARGETGVSRRRGGLLERDRYVTPTGVFEQIRMAQDAADSDDTVGQVLDSTEALAFSKVVVECDDPLEQNVWNQVARDVRLKARLQALWRELLVTSNVYAAVWFGRKSYRVEGKTESGRPHRKTFDGVWVPQAVTVLDPLKVVPLGGFMFGRERLVYAADWSEVPGIDAALDGQVPDEIVGRLIKDRYAPSLEDRRLLGKLNIGSEALYELDESAVWRFTATRSDYQPFAAVRLKSIFEILDLKHQLRQADRAALVGATNFIVLITKGTDKAPPVAGEIENLQQQVSVMPQQSVLVGDYRLNVKIVTPDTDMVLQTEKHLLLDMRVQGRMYGMFLAAKGDDSVKLARLVAAGMEARRELERDTVEEHVLMPAYEANDQFTSPPSIQFYPQRIALAFDPAMAAYILDLLDRGDLSRDTALNEAGYDQEQEFRKRKIEKEKYDDTMVPTVLPPGSPGLGPAGVTPPGQEGPTDPKAGGRRRGGNRSGGGAAPGSGQGQAPRVPAKPSTRTAAAAAKAARDAEFEAAVEARVRARVAEELAAAAATVRDAAGGGGEDVGDDEGED